MHYEDLIILLPCHSLEDFPVHHEGDAAQGLLAGWSALWHPALIAAVGRLPNWCRVDSPPEVFADRLLVIPAVSDLDLPAGLAARAQEAGAVVLRKMAGRDEIVAGALAGMGDDAPAGLDAELVADFLALGFVYLQVELLTRRMRYTSGIDAEHFASLVVAGAQAVVQGETATAKEQLLKCFELLTEARERFYPSGTWLLDITLVAATTLGPALRKELTSGAATSLLISGETVDELARDGDTRAALQAALANGHAALLGGEYEEGEAPLWDHETLAANLLRGLATYQERLHYRPKVFARRRFGESPVWPQLLVKTGFAAAWHVALEEGRLPRGEQAKMRWEGLDGSVIDGLFKPPHDAARVETFLNLSTHLGETMDHDHVACLCLAHWPGEASSWLADLRRMAAYAPALGRFATIDEYIQETHQPWQLARFTPDEYETPYLRQAIIRNQPDPISSHVARHAAAAAQLARSGAAMLVRSLSPATGDTTVLDVDPQRLAEEFAALIPRTAAAPQPGYLLVNPCSFTRRMVVDLPRLETLPTATGPVVAVGEDRLGPADSPSVTTVRRALVDVPPMGFVWVTGGEPSPPTPPARGKRPPGMVEGTTIRTDQLEVTINPVTGALQSVHDLRFRGNLISQQLALRSLVPAPPTADGHPGEPTVDYSVMAADAIEITSSGPLVGEITARGRLVDKTGQRLAGYVQRVQLVRGSRVVRLDIELDIAQPPRANPWGSYYACRFAWSDAAATLARDVAGMRHPTQADRLEAPRFVEIHDPRLRLAILTGGCPYHQHSGLRMLDTLLVVRGETARRFRLGIGVDVAQPAIAAWDLFVPPLMTFQQAPPPTVGPSSWLFHIDTKNVLATDWQPLIEAGQLTGFRVRLLETLGQPARTRLSAFRPLTQVQVVDFQGQVLAEAPLADGAALVDLAAYEWSQLEARWQ